MAENDKTKNVGLTNMPWEKKISPAQIAQKPIDRLKPGSDLHKKILAHLTDRIKFSEKEMCKFYDRWRFAERRAQAYINLSSKEQDLQDRNDISESPNPVSVVVPYSYATISTIVTYNTQTFAGRSPIWQVSSYGKTQTESALKMESWLQYNSDHTRFLRWLYLFLQNCEIYGLGVFRNDWRIEKARRTIRETEQPAAPPGAFFGVDLGPGPESQPRKEYVTTYAGNETTTIDPFMFFPDPRVPMSLVNKQGEFVFWREYTGKHELLKRQRAGDFKWVEAITDKTPSGTDGGSEASDRALRSGGNATPGDPRSGIESFNGVNYVQIDEGTVEIIPAELGLGDSIYPEKWIFTVANQQQIIQAEPFDRDHGMHPVSVAEPYELGYAFGQLGISDYLGPLQDTMSWFINSNIYNVRSALNNMFVVDPSMIDMQDIKNPNPGKVIRLKRAAYGQDVRQAVTQLNVADVTQGNIEKLEVFSRIADNISAVTDNIRGLQAPGGRKTATEMRIAGESAGSRLAMHARLISAQAMVPLTEQMTINSMQYMDKSIFLNVTGIDGGMNPQEITPEGLIGDYYFPVHDGTLPIDRVAMLDIWKELFSLMIGSPDLAARYDMTKVFEFIAELGGARNLARFEMKPEEQIAREVEKGNMVPLPGGPGGVSKAGSNNVGTEPQPRSRVGG